MQLNGKFPSHNGMLLFQVVENLRRKLFAEVFRFIKVLQALEEIVNFILINLYNSKKFPVSIVVK